MKTSHFDAYEILNSIHRYQQSFNANEYNDDLVIKKTIAIIRSLRKDIKMGHAHECLADYCNPQNILTFFLASQCSGKFNTEVHVCQYGQVHICNHACPTKTTSSETVVCPITNREKANFSTFSADSTGIISHEEKMHSSKRRLRSIQEEHQRQDQLYNEPSEVVHTKGYKKIRQMADRANRTIKKVAHRKKPKSIKKVTFSSKQKYDTLERWLKYCTFKSKFGHGYLISPGTSTLLADMMDDEKLKISVGDLRVYNALKDIEDIPKTYLDLIKVAEDVLEKTLPGLFRCAIDETFIETLLKYKYSIGHKYLCECKEKKILPNAIELADMLEFSMEKYLCVLTNWCTWEDWCSYIMVILHWWFICQNTIMNSNDQRCKSLDYTQHALSVLYMMRDELKIAEPFDSRIEHPLIAKDYKLSIPDYLMRINRLTACGILRKAFGLGGRALKGCINQALETVPIKALHFNNR